MLFLQCPVMDVPSRAILVARSQGDTYGLSDTCTTNGLRHGTQFGVPINSWQCTCGCVRMRARPWWTFQNVHITARSGTPCHSIVAPSLLIIYELFTKWHLNGIVINREENLEFFLIVSTFSPRYVMHYFTWPAFHASASARITCHGVNRLSVPLSRFAQVIKLCWFLVVQCQLIIVLLRCFFKSKLKRFTFKEFGVSN